MKLVALVCLCLVTRCGITAAGGNVREVVEEGSDVVLPCSLSTKENIESKLFDWRKDGQRENREVFLYDGGIHYNNGRGGQSETFKGRVFHFPDQLKNGNASITIRDTKVTDSGKYTCEFPRLQPSQTFHVELVVRAAPKPYVTSLKDTKDWALLQCEVRGASPEPRLEWQDSSGNILPAGEPQVTQRGGSYDVILNATVTKTDRYRCVATQETINHQIHSEIDVYIGGAAPEPSIKTLHPTEDGALLQCRVRGASPEPRLQWQDSSGNILPAGEPQVSERGGSYDVILNATVTKTDRYRCVATQETIGHQIYTETYVSVNGDTWKGNSESSSGWVGWIVAVVLGLLLICGVIAVLVDKGCIPLPCKKGTASETRVPLKDPIQSEQT